MPGLFKAKQPSSNAKLFKLSLHVLHGHNTEIPQNLVGTHVTVFIAATDHEVKVFATLSKLSSEGVQVC
jgi:hypothetical protein